MAEKEAKEFVAFFVEDRHRADAVFPHGCINWWRFPFRLCEINVSRKTLKSELYKKSASFK